MCSSFLFLSRMHSFNKLILSTYYLSRTVLGTWNTAVNKAKNTAFMLHYILISELFFPKVFTNNRQKEIAENKNDKLAFYTFVHVSSASVLVTFNIFLTHLLLEIQNNSHCMKLSETLPAYLVLKCDC